MTREEKIKIVAELDRGLSLLFDEILKGEDKRDEYMEKVAEMHSVINTPVYDITIQGNQNAIK